MKYKILLSLLVVCVLGCGKRAIDVDTDKLPNELYGKTRQEIKALYGPPTAVFKYGKNQAWDYDALWIDNLSEFAFESCRIYFVPSWSDEDKKESLRVTTVTFTKSR